MTTDAQKKATAKYLAGKKDLYYQSRPRGSRTNTKSRRKAKGKSVNAYILDAVQAWMEQEQPND